MTLDRALEDTLPYLFALARTSSRATIRWRKWTRRIRKRRTLDAIKRMLLRETLNQPLMVIFEDLHWIDDETQALLDLLADSIGTAKILLLVNYRPEYSHQMGQQDLLHAVAARPARQGERRGDAVGAAGRGKRSDPAQAAHHRADRGQPVLHGRDRAGAARRGRAGAQRRRSSSPSR